MSYGSVRSHADEAVLLVDTANAFRQVLALVLKWNTDLTESVEANSLTEARRFLGNLGLKPDLATVNLDIANPADGSELIKELRISAPGVPVLAITLRRDADRHDRALLAGADEVLTMGEAAMEVVDVTKRLVGE